MINEQEFTNRNEVLKLSDFIQQQLNDAKINYIDESFEKSVDNHMIELSKRILNNTQLNDEDNQVDLEQLDDDSWIKAKIIQANIEKEFNVKVTDFETFLVATHLMINK